MQSQAPIHLAIWVSNPLTCINQETKFHWVALFHYSHMQHYSLSHIYIYITGLRKVKQHTFTGIFHSRDSRVDTKLLLRPHMMTNCPIGFSASLSKSASPRAFAVFLTGPIPSPPPISKTACKLWSNPSSSLNWSYSWRQSQLKQWKQNHTL